MAANTAPIYVKAPRIDQVKLTTGSVTYDGSDATQLFVSGLDGSRLDRIRAMPVATTAASKLLVYIKEGAVFTLLQDWPLPLVVVANTTTANVADIPLGLNVPSGAEVWVQLTVGASWDITLFGGDF